MNHMISYDEKQNIFHLKTKNMSYVMQLFQKGYLAHVYWGKRIEQFRGSRGIRVADRAFSPYPDLNDKTFSLDTLPQEYPAYGNSDFRMPAIQIQFEDGSRITDFRYDHHEIYMGKRHLDGLPSTYVEKEDEAETLEIVMKDSLKELYLFLTFTIYKDLDVLTRNVRIVNHTKEKMTLLRAFSVSVDFADADYEWIHLSGAWARERDLFRQPIQKGNASIESRRGASSHQHHPFIALLRQGTNETQGEVYGFNLVYSGNFYGGIEVDQFDTTRVQMGINPFEFSWELAPSETFQTPEAVMVYSNQGLGQMSRTYHKLYAKRLCKGTYRDKIRPILINNWEATYFDFNAEKLLDLATKAKSLGIELMVLDDGWFGHRDNDKTSLGDWFVYHEKLPEGLAQLAKSIQQQGMMFGLWFEPEMISVESELYKHHPDWCLHVPDRTRSEGRNQLVLDLSRDEVVDAVIKMVSDILMSAPIGYVKWDMNRHMTEVGSPQLPHHRQKEVAHRYMLGLYRMMDQLTSQFPDVLFEGCSGGGGRFDPGILYYMPQIWTSDDSDAVERLKIQYSTSLIYPPITMGAHVSAVPNHQVNRVTSMKMRSDVAMAGNLGYELDVTKLPEETCEEIKATVTFYKEIRPLIQFGTFYRCLSPFEGNETAWMFVSEDQTEAIVFYYKVLGRAHEPLKGVKLQGLRPDYAYECLKTGATYFGDELMYAGVHIPELWGDFMSCFMRFKKVN